MISFKYIWFKINIKLRGIAIRGTSIHKTAKVEAGSIVVDSSFDRYSFCGYNCKIINTNIGSFCSLADGVVIGVAEHPVNWVSSSPVFYSGKDSVKRKFSGFSRGEYKKTIIENDVWIGERAMIKAGVHIGTGAIIGMGAVVTRDVDPYEIVAGVPAKHIRYRFDEKQKAELLESAWWNESDEKISKCAYLIRNPDMFVKEMKK